MSSNSPALPQFKIAAGLSTTRLGFGTSRMHYLHDAKSRQNVLSAAFDTGIRHFDTAPLYGHGLAERSLATFLGNKREHVTLATKWGLRTAEWNDLLPNSFMRYGALAATLSRRLLGSPSKPMLSSKLMEKSVDASLRRLNTDYIDILWMHEPSIETIFDVEEIKNGFERLIRSGKVRHVGVSGYGEHVYPVAEMFNVPEFLRQCDEQDWCSKQKPLFTFGVLSLGPQRHGTAPMNSKIVLDRLKTALDRRPGGGVLVSSTNSKRIEQLAKVFDAK